MPDDVAKKLEELRVDINTVELPESLDNISMEIPEVAADLKAAEYNYAGSICVWAPKRFPSVPPLPVKEEGDHWVLDEVAQYSMGPVSDKTILKKGSLELVSRQVKQGPATINLDISSDMITGNMDMGGNNTAIEQKLESPLFADGGGAIPSDGTTPPGGRIHDLLP
jgi:hypothetical protein